MRARAARASWARRTSCRLGSILAAIAKRLAGPSIPISAVILARSSSTTSVAPTQPIEDVAQILVATSTTQVPVIDHGVAIGVATRRAVGETLELAGPHAPVGLVTLGEVVVVDPGTALDDVLEELAERPGAVALVLDRGAPLGLVTREQLDAYLETRITQGGGATREGGAPGRV